MKDNQIAGVLTPILAQFDLELEVVEVIPAGKRRLLRVVVDGEGPEGRGPLLDDIAAAAKACSLELDTSGVDGSAAYTLEVTSRGVSRPLELPRHWRRNVGRLVEVSTNAGESLTGRILDSTEEAVTLDVDGTPHEVPFAEVKKALVQVELNRPSSSESEDV
ncbi:MAG: rimP [Friedmanniella sp.]|nr:rimP [Friedmanniella sp.]